MKKHNYVILSEAKNLKPRSFVALLLRMTILIICAGCTVKTVGDPNRPITINANITVDIRGLKNTATNIEDMVAGR